MSDALDAALTLTKPAGRRAAGRFLAEGPHVVADAIAASAAVETLFVAHDAAERGEVVDLVRTADAAGVRVHRIGARQMERLADTRTPQGVIAVVVQPERPAEPFREPGLWLLLDAVQDPGNVGTLLRSAEAFGARGVVAGPGTADLWSGKVMRAAQGAHFRLVLLDDDPDPVLEAFAAAGGEVWAATRDGDDIYRAPPPPAKAMLALGNEARGLCEEALAYAKRRVSVPQRGRADSLNVAMAGSILLSWMAERRA